MIKEIACMHAYNIILINCVHVQDEKMDFYEQKLSDLVMIQVHEALTRLNYTHDKQPDHSIIHLF